MPTTILAIDDSPTLRKFISKHLSGTPEQFEVLTAPNGEDGVQIALEKQPQLILLDFILPDFNGDKVCEKLADSELTRTIPIILMSSSAPDIEKTESAFDTIVRSIVKPFSPQLLLDTVQDVLKGSPVQTPAPATTGPDPFNKAAEDEPKPSGTPPVVIPQRARETRSATEAATETVKLQGNLAHFPLLYVIRASAGGASTGRLELDFGTEPMVVFLRKGLPCLTTSRDPDAYLSSGEFEIDEDSLDYFETLKDEQRQTGRPVFLRMADENIIPPEQANDFLQQYGDYYFSQAWTLNEGTFRFYPMRELPDYCPQEPMVDSIDAWCLQTLRCVSPQAPLVEQSVQAEDTPQLDARGYHLVQSLPLNEVEVSFICQLAATPGTVASLASQIGESVESLKPVIFRLRQMEIVALWTATE